MKTAILIDSSAGIKEFSKYENVFLAPLMIINSKGDSIKDDEKLSADQFYEMNDKDILKTSQSIVGDMYKKWDELLTSYDNIICLFISKGLSGQYATFKMLSNEEEYLDKIHVVDTNGVAVVIKRQVELAIKLLNSGKQPADVAAIIEELYANNVGFIIPKTLEQLVRGGRISRAAAAMAKLFKITPILKYDGIIDKEDKTRTFKKAIRISLEKIKESHSGDYVIDIAWSRADPLILEDVISEIKTLGLKVGLIDEMPNVIVCHTGRETFALIPYYEYIE